MLDAIVISKYVLLFPRYMRQSSSINHYGWHLNSNRAILEVNKFSHANYLKASLRLYAAHLERMITTVQLVLTLVLSGVMEGTHHQLQASLGCDAFC
jgi:hypothetical protein